MEKSREKENLKKSKGVNKKSAKILRDVFCIVLGSALMAIAINCIYEPMSMVVGGLTGLGIAFRTICARVGIYQIPLWIFTLVGNIPLLAVAWVRLGHRFIRKTICGTLLLTLFLMVIPQYPLIQNDYLLAAAGGGALTGLGIGMIFYASASTGGSDLFSVLLAKRTGLSAPNILVWVDGIIVALGCLVFGVNTTLYAVISVMLTAKISDGVLEGFHYAKAVMIISGKAEQISEEIMARLNRGVTGLPAKGMYTKKQGMVAYCVVSKREVGHLQELILEIDPDAFVVIQDVRKVMGAGFIENQQ